MNKVNFASDYVEGAHPEILRRMSETNFEKTAGYGLDPYCESAKNKIREACKTPDAGIFFLTGGTQTNAVVIASLLRPYEGVISSCAGHIAAHEAGAIEATGHKIILLTHREGKIAAQDIEQCFINYENDQSREHTVMPGMVYISHPTEYGTLYSKGELQKISAVCRGRDVPLFLDGARLGYALAAAGTDVTLELIAKCCDVFYIGGTKVGALFGEAVVIPKKNYVPHFFTMMKRHGALLAKGRLLGIQFDTLFSNSLYFEISKHAIVMAEKLKTALLQKGYKFLIDSPTNQIFVIMQNSMVQNLKEKVVFSIWEPHGENQTVIRLTTSWATKPEDLDDLIEIMRNIK